MGTIFEIIIYSERDEFFLRSLTEQLFEDIDRYENSMSLFIQGSDIDVINKFSGKRAVRVSPEVFEIIKLSKYYSEITGGYFDITVGPLMKLWGFYRKRDKVPSDDEITDVLEKVGSKNIVLNDEDRSVYLVKDEMVLDLGGVAKGWCVKKLVEKLKSFHIENFLINSGMSSVYASGSPGTEKYWRAELPNVYGFSFSDEKIYLKDNAVSVSGTYEKVVQLGENKYSHIINPLTGKSESKVILTVVINSDSLECEILSTAFSAMGVHKTKEFLKERKDFVVIVIFFDEKNKIRKIKLDNK
jgi:thiamine biosynthesis lipoprotein